nr:type II toxin-antitoxin system VapC family toxin [Candidatus Njordarchaeota archaeon]
MPYIDSSVLIYPIIYEEAIVAEAGRCKDLLFKIASGEFEAYTASLTWDEVTWVVRKLSGIDSSLDVGRKLLSFPNLRLLGVKKTTISQAQEIAEKYRLSPRDSIHVATALENRIATVVSYDRDFDSVKEIKRIEP